MIRGFSTTVVVASAKLLGISWSDCGDSDSHGIVSDLQPASFDTETFTTVTLDFMIDEDVSAGTFEITGKFDGIPFPKVSGDLCDPTSQSMTCPLQAGSVARWFINGTLGSGLLNTADLT